jgi:hypothetical protein
VLLMTITEFLEARIGEDEAVARAATDGPWRYDQRKVNAIDRSESVFAGLSGVSATTVASTGPADDTPSMNDARHIARHDPFRVLAECAAKRAILADRKRIDRSAGMDYWHAGYSDANYDALRSLAAVYATHPDYRQEWAI